MAVPILIKYISLRTSFTPHIHTYRIDHVTLDKQSRLICEQTISLFLQSVFTFRSSMYGVGPVRVSLYVGMSTAIVLAQIFFR